MARMPCSRADVVLAIPDHHEVGVRRELSHRTLDSHGLPLVLALKARADHGGEEPTKLQSLKQRLSQRPRLRRRDHERQPG